MPIQEEQDQVKILATLIAFGDDTVWTRRVLSQISQIPLDRTTMAIFHLIKAVYLVKYHGRYVVTDKGRNYYKECSKQPAIFEDLTLWKDEVLTGMTAAGMRSPIDTAVLPSPSHQPRQLKDPESLYSHAEFIRQLEHKMMQKLGISLDTLRKHMKEGRIKTCKGTKWQSRHLGIFDMRNQTGREPETQSLCRKCRKETR